MCWSRVVVTWTMARNQMVRNLHNSVSTGAAVHRGQAHCEKHYVGAWQRVDCSSATSAFVRAACADREAARWDSSVRPELMEGGPWLWVPTARASLFPHSFMFRADNAMTGARRLAELAGHTPGYCATTPFTEGDCLRGDSGSWHPRRHGLANLAACVARCRRCPRCNYVSFKAGEDCSWYQTCEHPLQTQFAGFTTVAVRQGGPTAPSPPPPPLPPPPPRTSYWLHIEADSLITRGELAEPPRNLPPHALVRARHERHARLQRERRGREQCADGRCRAHDRHPAVGRYDRNPTARYVWRQCRDELCSSSRRLRRRCSASADHVSRDGYHCMIAHRSPTSFFGSGRALFCTPWFDER